MTLRLRKFLPRFVLFMLSAAALLAAAFVVRDLETQTLSDADRKQHGMQQVALQHGTVAYQLANPGAPITVVMVHGFSVPSYVWDKNYSYFAERGFRTLRFDLYGRGLTDRPHLDYGLDLYVEQLLDLLRALDISGPIHLAGLSMGGPVTARFTHRYPEMVASLSLLAPLIETPNDPAMHALKVPYLGEYLATTLMMPRIVNGLENSVYDTNSFTDWDTRMQEHAHYSGYRRALLTTLRYLAGRSFIEDYARLGESKVPVQLAWGINDQVVPFSQHTLLLSEVPHAHLLSLDHCGHLPQREHPEVVNPWLESFMQAHSAR